MNSTHMYWDYDMASLKNSDVNICPAIFLTKEIRLSLETDHFVKMAEEEKE